MPRGNARKRAPAEPDAPPHRDSTATLKILTRPIVADQTECAPHSDVLEQARPNASEELQAALRETGDAVNTIIDQAEKVLDYDGSSARAYRATVQSAMLRILEVCAFEDLTGQRITKVVEVLRNMEAESQGLCEAPAGPQPSSKRQRAGSPLDGPAINAPHMSQADIDAVFAE